MAASNVNVVVITGNLTRDPDLRSTPSGTSVCNLRVAVNSRRKDGQTGEWVDKPNYFNVTVWGAQGESCAEYLAKGRPVAIEGRLDWREWDAKDGAKRESVDIIANSVQFLGSKPEEGSEAGEEPASKVTPASSDKELLALDRSKLDELAAENGVESPEEYSDSKDVVGALRDYEAEQVAAEDAAGEDDIPF